MNNTYITQYVSTKDGRPIVVESEPFFEEMRADALRHFFFQVQAEVEGKTEDLYTTGTMCLFENNQLIAVVYLQGEVHKNFL